MSLQEADKSNIQRAEFIRTYYSGKETPASKRGAVPAAKLNRIFYRILGAIAVFLLVLTAGAVTANYLLSKRPRPINISKGETSSPIRYYSNISYYDYEQLENMQGPILLEHSNSCVAINLGKTRDLRDGIISFASKGECGKEQVAIILRDANRMSNANQEDIILTPILDNGKWQLFNLRLKQLYLPLDMSRITQVRFKISFKDTKEDYPRAKVYIKDIIIW